MIGGRWAAEFLTGLNIETAFVSAGGVTLEHGLTTTRRALADTLHAAMASSKRTVGADRLDEVRNLGAALDRPRREELDAVVVDDGLRAGDGRGIPRRRSQTDRLSAVSPPSRPYRLKEDNAWHDL